MALHAESYRHNGLPVYVFPAVDYDVSGEKVVTVKCPFLEEFPRLHSTSRTHKRKVFSDVSCGGFSRSLENHARDKTACGKMFKKPCYLQAADGELRLYDPGHTGIVSSITEADEENQNPNSSPCAHVQSSFRSKDDRFQEVNSRFVYLKDFRFESR